MAVISREELLNGSLRTVYIQSGKRVIKTTPLESRRKQGSAHRGKPGVFTGKHHSEESKQKIKENSARRNNPGTMTGKHHSKETIQKISKTLRDKGEPGAFKGRYHSKETKLKIGRANKDKCVGENNGNWNSDREARYFPYTEEHYNLEVRAQIFYEQSGKCSICGSLLTAKNKKLFQIINQNFKQDEERKPMCLHHIDHDKGNDARLNKVYLCNSCNGRCEAKGIKGQELGCYLEEYNRELLSSLQRESKEIRYRSVI